MEYRRRRTGRRTGRRGGVSGTEGGAFRALILLILFGAAVYLLLGTGIGARIRDGYMLSLVSSCRGSAEKPSPSASFVPAAETPAPSPAPSPSPAPTGETVEIELPSIGVYMLQMGFYKSETECAAAAQKLKEQGAAGYAYADGGSLRLIAAAFSDMQSAESVCTRLGEEGLECTVYKLERSGVKLMVTAAEERILPIRTAFSLCSDAVDQLDELSIDFDAESRSIDFGTTVLAELRTNISNAAAGISDPAGSNEMLSHVLNYLKSLTEMINEAASGTASRTEFASSLKALRIKASLEYVSLLQAIGG